MNSFGISEMHALLGHSFAPWVQELAIEPLEITATGATFRLPENPRLVRASKTAPPVVCGQSIAAVADTASVLTLCAPNGRFRDCTTVDMTTHFLRPMFLGDVEIMIEAQSNGRRMAVTRAEFRAAGSQKLAATATCAFVYLED